MSNDPWGAEWRACKERIAELEADKTRLISVLQAIGAILTWDHPSRMLHRISIIVKDELNHWFPPKEGQDDEHRA